jgi:arginine/lysine/ornithine decarboxylase
MLPALTGAAMLHTSSRRYAKMLRQCMSLFASTSPSYLIMASLDLCNRYISEDIRNDTARGLQYIKELRESFSGRLVFADGDPFHITVKAAESGYDGNSFADVLRKNKVECEYSDSSLVILLMSPFNVAEDYLRLCIALEDAVASAEKCEKVHESFYLPLPEKVMSVRQAVFSPSETIPVDEAEGCVCASVKVPCPPAVPIAVSGEVISRECIDIFKRYGISEVIVVKKR